MFSQASVILITGGGVSVAVQGALHPGGSLSGGSLSRGGLCYGDPPYGNERAVCIPLECILVSFCLHPCLELST